jgi:hypothetical protein
VKAAKARGLKMPDLEVRFVLMGIFSSALLTEVTAIHFRAETANYSL